LDLKEIKELIALMRKNDLSVFKLEQADFKITLKRGAEPVITNGNGATIAYPVAAPTPLPADSSSPVTPTGPAVAAGEKLKEVTSPMVGTFYGSSSPDSPPFLKVGQIITADTVVCIIEAMKVMNEIKAEQSGTVVEIVAENGKPVQYGQALFRIRPA
jgi:acetyl-CoA carboxylase biotin carboxyl carrier protein